MQPAWSETTGPMINSSSSPNLSGFSSVHAGGTAPRMRFRHDTRATPGRLVALAIVVLALIGCAPTATAATTVPRGRLLGVVPHRGHVSRLAPASGQAAPTTTNLTYHGGPVMHTNKT